jgi:hypothetical protein
MKPGLVVSIRVNPVDCQSVLALMDASGLPRSNQSFASMVSMVLSGMLAGARRDGVIAEPDPFLYWEQMGQYHRGSNGKGREAVADAMRKGSKVMASREVGKATMAEVLADATPEGMTAEQRRAGLRLTELIVKQEHARDSWDANDQAEYDRLYKIVYPYG